MWKSNNKKEDKKLIKKIIIINFSFLFNLDLIEEVDEVEVLNKLFCLFSFSIKISTIGYRGWIIILYFIGKEII